MEGFKKTLEGISDMEPVKEITDDTKLKLYGLYKQVLVGDINKPRPGMFDFKGGAKWDAWSSYKGKSQEEAIKEYMNIIDIHYVR